MIREVGLEYWLARKMYYTRESGIKGHLFRAIKLDHKDIIKANSKMAKEMGKGNFNGTTDKAIKVNGKMGSNKDQECGSPVKVIATSDNGQKAKFKAMECMLLQMNKDTKDSLNNFSSMEKVNNPFRTETLIKVSIKMENLMEKEDISGKIKYFMKDSLSIAKDKEKVKWRLLFS